MDEQFFAVQRMQEYIERHFDENITMEQLAYVANYSKWYSHKIFCKYLKMAPARYIRRLRLSKSALEIAKGDAKVTDIAFAFGFNSVDGYQRAFCKEFGCNPKEYAKNPVVLNLFIPKKINYRENTKMKSTKILVSLILCFTLGFGGGYLVKANFFGDKDQNSMSFKATEVSAALNSTYLTLNNQNLGASLSNDEVLVKSKEKNMSSVVSTNSTAELIENEGSVVSNGSISMELKNLSTPVLKMINELFKQGSYDLMSTTLLFEIRNADVMPADFDLKIKMTGYEGGIGLELYMSYEGGSSYNAIFLGLKEDSTVKSITSLYVEGTTLLYGIYDVAQDKTYTLNPAHANYSSHIAELNNYVYVMQYTPGTLKTGINIVDIFKTANGIA